MQLVRALRAEPGDGVELVALARSLDDQADRTGRTPRRVVDALRQQENLALLHHDPALAAFFHHVHGDVALQLVEDLVVGVEVEVVARVRAADHLVDEIRALEDFPVADRAKRMRQVALDPFLLAERRP